MTNDKIIAGINVSLVAVIMALLVSLAFLLNENKNLEKSNRLITMANDDLISQCSNQKRIMEFKAAAYNYTKGATHNEDTRIATN